jgi:hypothetical protein
MRKAIFVILAAVLLIANGRKADALVNERVDNYYADATFVTACGYTDTTCGNIWDFESDGCYTNYRYHEIYSCSTGERQSAECQEYDGTQWVTVACPDETLTAQTRVHITVG